MKVIYIEKEIEDTGLTNLTGINCFSDLLFNRSTLLNRLVRSFENKMEVEICDDIGTEKGLEKKIFWTSNVTFINQEIQKIFLRKLNLIDQDVLFGDKNGFIFKGSGHCLQFVLEGNLDHIDLDFLPLKNENNLRVIRTSKDYKNLIVHLPESRYFNSLEVKEGWIKKKSRNQIKILREFNQLQNVPSELKDFFVKSKNYIEVGKESYYEVERIDGVDLSLMLLSNQISDEFLEGMLKKLSTYLNISKNII